jgi:hypothetical protein
MRQTTSGAFRKFSTLFIPNPKVSRFNGLDRKQVGAKLPGRSTRHPDEQRATSMRLATLGARRNGSRIAPSARSRWPAHKSWRRNWRKAQLGGSPLIVGHCGQAIDENGERHNTNQWRCFVNRINDVDVNKPYKRWLALGYGVLSASVLAVALVQEVQASSCSCSYSGSQWCPT